MWQNADQNNSEHGQFLRSVGSVTKLDKRNTATSTKKKKKEKKSKQNDDVMSANSDSSVYFLIYD